MPEPSEQGEIYNQEGEDTEKENSAIPSEHVQKCLVTHVRKVKQEYEKLNKSRNQTMLEIYEAFSTYKMDRQADWKTTFKVNKAHEIVERVVPRIVAKNPRWMVSPNSFPFISKDIPEEDGTPEGAAMRYEAIKKRQDLASEHAKTVQDYLDYIFNEYNFRKDLRLFAKNMVVSGKGRAKVSYKYEVARVLGDDGVEEVVTGEYPYVEVKSWTEVLTDPRYRTVRDMPCYLEFTDCVRYHDLKRKKEYFNLDDIKDIVDISDKGDHERLKQSVSSISGIEWTTKDGKFDKNALSLTTYYGYFCEDEDGDEEKMIKATLVNNSIVIGYKYITKIPFVEGDCFEDTETNFAVGFVEPILGLQDELNFKKNAASEYINHALNRSWLWSPDSGVNPKDLISKPNNIIKTTESVAVAQANLQEIPHRDLPADYFQELLDIERQIQGQTFTVDTSSQKGQQALTDTATGMRIEFFESNSVLDEVRKHYEQALSELAYLLLQEAYENIEDNIVFKKMGTEEYVMMHKELLRDAIQKYKIQVEVNSSSFDDIENRRRDAMALGIILKQASEAGVNINWEKWIIESLETFEKREPQDYIKPPDIQAVAQKVSDIGNPQALPPPATNEAAALTEEVAKGNITSAVR